MKIWTPIALLAIFSLVIATAIHKPEAAFVREGNNVVEAYMDAAMDFNLQARNGQNPQLNMGKVEASKQHAKVEVQKAGDEGMNLILNLMFILLLLGLCAGAFLFFSSRSRY